MSSESEGTEPHVEVIMLTCVIKSKFLAHYCYRGSKSPFWLLLLLTVDHVVLSRLKQDLSLQPKQWAYQDLQWNHQH